jgi:hypothetical protein
MPVILTSDWDSRVILAIAKKMPRDKAKRWETHAGHMFFKHRRAIYHRQCIQKCYAKMLEEMPVNPGGRRFEEGTNSSYAGPLAEVLLFHLDGFFEAERSGHDFVLSCLRTADLLRTAPSSFHKFYESETRQHGTYSSEPPELGAELTTFWAKIGQRTKDYRDCFSHYVSLAGPTWQHAVKIKWTNGSWKATLCLPDNPDAKSHKAFTFDANLDALGVCTQINVETERFLKRLMEVCAKKWEANADVIQDTQITLHNIRLGD